MLYSLFSCTSKTTYLNENDNRKEKSTETLIFVHDTDKTNVRSTILFTW